MEKIQITDNFTLDEFTRSDKATKYGIDNTPSNLVIGNITLLCVNVLQPLRDALRKAVNITSGFRNEELNRLVGGSATSDHTKGKAVDIKVKGMTPAQLRDFILQLHLPFDQLITYGNKSIVHISYRDYGNRNQVLYYRKW